MAYCLAALFGSLWPVNAQWEQAGQGEVIYLHDNGIHTSIIVPRSSVLGDPGNFFADLWDMAPGADGQPTRIRRGFPGSAVTFPLLAIGWGDRDFFLDTPSWSEVRPTTALTAAFGSGYTLIHVDQLTGFPPGDLRKLILTKKEYGDLLAFVVLQMEGGFAGQPTALLGYGPDDRFYATRGQYRYSALFTCNNWAAEGLKKAGVRVGAWTPISDGMMWWF